MACNCVNCGLALDRPLYRMLVKDDAPRYYCDKSCANQWVRENIKDEVEIKMAHYESELKVKHPCVGKRFCVIMVMFYKALLARKPREELLRLNKIRRKMCCEAIEYYMEKKDDKFVFYFGEEFKINFDSIIDAWAAPQ